MSTVNTPFPTPYLPCPGEPAIPFTTWEKIFRNYLLVINASGDEWPEARTRALLLHCLGTEGQQIFYTLPDTGDTLDSAIAALQTHFNPKINVVAERHAFRKRTQATSESVLHYVAALRDLVSKCEFGANTDDMIRDQLIEHVASHRIRERLLLETDLTLSKAITITIATQIEAASAHAKSIAGDQAASVQAVQSRSCDAAGRRRHNASCKPAKPSSSGHLLSTSSSRTCYRCGSDKHLANAQNCPAIRAKRKNCQKTGHFVQCTRFTCRSILFFTCMTKQPQLRLCAPFP